MDIKTQQDAVCLGAICSDNRDDLNRAIGCLLSEAYAREIVPSFIDFHPLANDELALTLYGYPRSVFSLV